MRIAKHFICIPYHLIFFLAIVLCLFYFTQSLSFTLSLYPFFFLSHTPILSVLSLCVCESLMHAPTFYVVVYMQHSLVHFVLEHHFLYVEVTHFLTTGSFSLQVLTQHTVLQNSVGSFSTIPACSMHMKAIYTYLYIYIRV